MVANEFTPIYQGLCRLHKEIQDPVIEGIYFKSLHLYSVAQVRAAVRKCTDSIKWMPKPAEIVEAIPVTRRTADDWDALAGIKPGEKSVFTTSGKYSVAHLSDEELTDKLQAFRRSYPDGLEWDERQLSWMIKHCRGGNEMFNQTVLEA